MCECAKKLFRSYNSIWFILVREVQKASAFLLPLPFSFPARLTLFSSAWTVTSMHVSLLWFLSWGQTEEQSQIRKLRYLCWWQDDVKTTRNAMCSFTWAVAICGGLGDGAGQRAPSDFGGALVELLFLIGKLDLWRGRAEDYQTQLSYESFIFY